jgi:hypothetical protein
VREMRLPEERFQLLARERHSSSSSFRCEAAYGDADRDPLLTVAAGPSPRTGTGRADPSRTA